MQECCTSWPRLRLWVGHSMKGCLEELQLKVSIEDEGRGWVVGSMTQLIEEARKCLIVRIYCILLSQHCSRKQSTGSAFSLNSGIH